MWTSISIENEWDSIENAALKLNALNSIENEWETNLI